MNGKHLLVATVFLVTACAVALADSLDDPFLSSALGDLNLNGLDDKFSRGNRLYQPRSPFALGGSVHVANVSDLVNLLMGLSGHVVGRAGWIVHDALRSLFEGVMKSRYRLGSGGVSDYYYPSIANPQQFGGKTGFDDFDNLKFYYVP